MSCLNCGAAGRLCIFPHLSLRGMIAEAAIAGHRSGCRITMSSPAAQEPPCGRFHGRMAMRHVLQIVASVLALLTLVARVQAEPVPPVAKSIKANETAILLVDFQANFVSPDGAWYGKFAEHYKKTKMLDRIVELVRKARAKGVLVVHITEGYTSDYRELDPTNPGMFHRGQIGRSAWKIGSKEAAYYEPLKPAAGDRDLFLPPRSQASGFGGTGLSEILRSKGIKNVAGAGVTTHGGVHAPGFSAVEFRFHGSAVREGMG